MLVTMRVIVVALAIHLLVAPMLMFSVAMDFHEIRQKAAKNNVTCVLVFGDSSVDPGNNNRLAKAPKGNFLPYGKDFFNGHPTGRFSNGRLATDFIAEAIGYENIIQGFLDPTIEKVDLLHGVSFASAGSGYDDLTANLSNSLPVWKQLEYFGHYKVHLKQLVGEMEADKIIRDAVVVISMGTNDFLQNYYVEPTRSKQFSVTQYQNYLISLMFHAVKTMYKMGARRFAVVGVPPLGCIPIVKVLKDESKCDDAYNKVAFSFNSMIKQKLATLNASLGTKTSYIDIYNVIASGIKSPKTYGFKEVSKGCCGSGLVEFGETCKGMSTCDDPTKYVFWDAVHPTEKMYEMVAVQALKSILQNMLN